MNEDADALNVKRKKTARVVCIVAAVLVLVPCLGLKWMKAGRGLDGGVSLLFVHPPNSSSESNLDEIDIVNNQAFSDKDKILGTYAYAGIATLFFAVVAAGALGAAGGLAFKDKFIRTPVALTTVALLALCLSLICGCVFLGAMPKFWFGGGVSWPFFLYGVGNVTGLAGAQMLAKAYSEVRDPYWDGLDQNP
ncbi:MAG TPA: hypothetical protein VM261_08665 [Kofleriaceae bacterium]|nr:hypothetical protein [Kofleriaceae bacterium]